MFLAEGSHEVIFSCDEEARFDTCEIDGRGAA